MNWADVSLSLNGIKFLGINTKPIETSLETPENLHK